MSELAGWQHPRYGTVSINLHNPAEPPIKPNDPDWKPVFKESEVPEVPEHLLRRAAERKAALEAGEKANPSLSDVIDQLHSNNAELIGLHPELKTEMDKLLQEYETFKTAQLPRPISPYKLGFFAKLGRKLDIWIASRDK